MYYYLKITVIFGQYICRFSINMFSVYCVVYPNKSGVFIVSIAFQTVHTINVSSID